MAATDEELRNAFRELQTKMTDMKQRIAQGEAMKDHALKNEKASRLAAQQLTAFGDRPIYQGIGRLFLLTTHSAEIERHLQEAEEFKQKVISVDKQKEFLQRSCDESEKNLREMIEARR